VKPLGRLFRGKFLFYLEAAFAAGRLEFYGQLCELAHPVRFQEWISGLKQVDWVVCAKPPFGGPHQVLRYLAHYTHRVAISNGRLIALEAGRVRFRWRDSKSGNQIKEMSLDAVEFIRRFLLHVLPSGFVKIRHFGFLSNRNRKAMVQHCRNLLPTMVVLPIAIHHVDTLCPVCRIGHLRLITAQTGTQAENAAAAHPVLRLDSS
jgi:Putative transposase